MRYEVSTGKAPADILAQAISKFGPSGDGLQVTSQTTSSAVFEGGGGHVAVVVRSSGADTSVELETREWDFQVRQFVQQIH